MVEALTLHDWFIDGHPWFNRFSPLGGYCYASGHYQLPPSPRICCGLEDETQNIFGNKVLRVLLTVTMD